MPLLEDSIRPIRLSLIDLMAVFIPGFTWLLLIISGILITTNFSNPAITPYTALLKILEFANNNESKWIFLFIIILVSFMIGYMLKPIAMEISEEIIKYMCNKLKMEKIIKVLCNRYLYDIENVDFKKLTFPFNNVHTTKPYHKMIAELINGKIGCKYTYLPCSGLFTIAKRYLRITSPALWDESERMEAEVRMSGVLFLASIYSILSSGITLILWLIFQRSINYNLLWWVILSIISFVITLVSFMHMRDMEVSYTYINVLIANSNLVRNKNDHE